MSGVSTIWLSQENPVVQDNFNISSIDSKSYLIQADAFQIDEARIKRTSASHE
jgi:hypothetical protein